MSGRIFERFATEVEARLAGRLASLKRQGDEPIYVIKSPDQANMDKPFSIDSDGFTRNWELMVARYECGQEVTEDDQ